MGGDNRNSPPSAQRSGFNPRPRMGGDAQLHLLRVVLEVSIHAPAWGATHVPGAAEDQGRVSIHAPAWGATSVTKTSRLSTEFQSTPPHGGRPGRKAPHGPTYPVSIHAPAWGATMLFFVLLVMVLFQSTPPHGGRRALSLYFRHRMKVSIHAPAWGATVTAHTT